MATAFLYFLKIAGAELRNRAEQERVHSVVCREHRGLRKGPRTFRRLGLSRSNRTVVADITGRFVFDVELRNEAGDTLIPRRVNTLVLRKTSGLVLCQPLDCQVPAL